MDLFRSLMSAVKMKRKLLLVFVCAVALFIIMSSADREYISQRVMALIENNSEEDDIDRCRIVSHEGFPDLESDGDRPNPGRNIFFHETSCFGEQGVILNARQACAVESAARTNPRMTVYLLFSSSAKLSNEARKFTEQLLNYTNVRIRHIFPDKYVQGTPLEEWYTSGALRTSRWPRSHMSDVMRYLTLWKYGGIYLDLDVVVTTSLEHLKNFAGAEDKDNVAAGVMGFDATPLGRRMANACLRDLQRNFRGDVWGNNGPGVITRTLQKMCSTKYTRAMTAARCHGFKVYPPSAFYPIHYKNWKRYFDAFERNSTMKIVERARAIHVWNKLSKSQIVRVDSNVPYTIIARKYCPNVIANCGETF